MTRTATSTVVSWMTCFPSRAEGRTRTATARPGWGIDCKMYTSLLVVVVARALLGAVFESKERVLQ